jgi:hypothetical protein
MDFSLPEIVTEFSTADEPVGKGLFLVPSDDVFERPVEDQMFQRDRTAP